MTEYSKGSAANQPQTVSRTNQPPSVQPYSQPQQSSSPNYSHYSQHSHPSQSEQDEDYVELAMSYIMPLVSTIKQENDHLQSQQRQLTQDMGTLNTLSKQLLNENEELRRHYAARTHDIRRLIQTISINTHEDTNDAKHEAFLVKESNIALAKKIEEQIRVVQQIDLQNQHTEGQIQTTSQECFELKQANRDLQVRNKQLEQQCEEQQIISERSQDLSTIDSQINDVLADVANLRNHNRQKCQEARIIRDHHDEEKPQFEGNQAALKRTIAELAAEERTLKETENSAQRKKEVAQQGHQKSATKLREALREYERTKDAVVQQEQDIIQTRNLLNKNSQEEGNSQQKLVRVKKEKEELLKQINDKKKSLKRQLERQREEKEQLRARIKSQVDKVKLEMAKKVKTSDEQSGKMVPQLQGAKQAVEENKEEYAHLVQEIADFRDSLGRLDNPVKQIIRVEYQVKKLKAKKA